MTILLGCIADDFTFEREASPKSKIGSGADSSSPFCGARRHDLRRGREAAHGCAAIRTALHPSNDNLCCGTFGNGTRRYASPPILLACFVVASEVRNGTA